jgi:putative transposase
VNQSPDDPPVRHNPSSGVHIQLGDSNVVFLTITTEKRIPWLATTTAQQFLHETWLKATAWLVGDYLLMPDHLHLYCAPRDLHFTVEIWIAYWKREFSLKHKRKDWKFQSRGWHHRIRNGENHSEKWLYMQENPVRRGLVAKMEDWPFKGKVFDLNWTGR